MTDPATTKTLLRRIDGLLPDPSSFRLVSDRQVVGRFYGATITSAFQPLHHPVAGKVVAYEGLARSYSPTGDGLSPWRLFADAAADEHLVALDRLCRTIHVLNFRTSGLDDGEAKLVLNVHERLLHAVMGEHGRFFRQVLDMMGIPAARIVIDISVPGAMDVHYLKRVVESYRRAGFVVAMEVSDAVQAKLFGSFVRPDWVRIPASLIGRELVSRIQAMGLAAVATPVETRAIHDRCVAAGVDVAQGFLYGGPSQPGAHQPAECLFQKDINF